VVIGGERSSTTRQRLAGKICCICGVSISYNPEAVTMSKVIEFSRIDADVSQYALGCDDAVGLTKSFILSCVSALESGQSANFNARFESYIRYRAECEKCNGV
jgi:hypothetical protein